MQLFRIEPPMPAEGYKTYGVSAPLDTHFRKGTCAEVDCENMARGFTVTADVSTELGQKQANYIRLHSGRHFNSAQAGDLVTFTFPAGQQCFATHRVLLDREPICYLRGGDWRGNPLGIQRQTMSAQDWVDDFGEHQERIAEQKERG